MVAFVGYGYGTTADLLDAICGTTNAMASAVSQLVWKFQDLALIIEQRARTWPRCAPAFIVDQVMGTQGCGRAESDRVLPAPCGRRAVNRNLKPGGKGVPTRRRAHTRAQR